MAPPGELTMGTATAGQPVNPLTDPDEFHPRWRLRVFDQRWPWRATRREAVMDAIASRHARRDSDDRQIYLQSYALIQQDPPPRLGRLSWEERRRMRLAAEREER